MYTARRTYAPRLSQTFFLLSFFRRAGFAFHILWRFCISNPPLPLSKSICSVNKQYCNTIPIMSERSSSHVRNDVKQTPEFSSTALEIQNSPPLTSSLHSRHSASSAQESAYLRQASYLRWARLATSVLLIGVGAVIVGCEGHALHEYNMTALEGGFFLPLWPANTDLRSTTGTIAAGAVIILSSLLYFLVALIPSVSFPKSCFVYNPH